MNLFDLCVYKNLNKESGGDVDVSSLVATENKTYNAGTGKAYNPVVVNVPTPSPSLQSLTASHNGYFVPSSGYDGFDEVTVEVATPLETLNATENGTYTPSSGYEGFSEVTVDVPLPNNAYLLESQKNDVVTIQHGAEFDMPKLIASIEPQQDLHGYDAPWVGGSGKNKSEKKISEFSYAPNANGSATVSGDILTVTTTSSNNSGVYSILDFVESFTGKCSYSVDVKANTNGDVLIGMTNAGRKTVSLTTNWQRVKFEDVTFDGDSKTFVIYSQGIENTIQVKNFMFELGSVAHDYEPYSNECPISGWDEINVNVSGVNVWDEEWEVGTISTSTGEYSASGDRVCSKNYIRVVPNKSYYKQNFAWQFYYDEYKNFISATSIADGVFTTPNNAHYMKFYTSSAYGQTYNNDISINYPSTDTSYHAYNGNTYTINFVDGSNPLTVYGGTLNVLTGLLTVTHGFKAYTGTESWSQNNARYYLNEIPQGLNTNRKQYTVCNQAKYYDAPADYGSYFVIGGSGIYFNQISSSETLDQFKARIASTTIRYELATPQTYQLTPTQVKSLLGVNNIFADTGEVDVQIWTKEVTS